MNKGESVLKLHRVSFSDVNYKRNTDIAFPEETPYNMTFTREIFSAVVDEKGTEMYKVALSALIESTDENKSVQLQIRVNGYFECVCEDEKTKETLLNQNAVAILFPYLRSQISLVTTQPDMRPITLQAFNISTLFSE